MPQGGDKPQGGQPMGGDQPGQPGKGEPGQGQPGQGQPGQGQPGGEPAGGDQPGGDQPGGAPPMGQPDGGPQPGQGGSSPTAPSGGGGREGAAGDNGRPGGAAPAGATPPAGEAADLDHTRQAAELTLQRLKDGLDRGDVDQKLLEELGWNEGQLRKFVDRMSESLRTTSEESATPQDAARRLQFEEMLKSLDLNRTSRVRKAGDQPSREVEQVDSRRTPVPLEYRRAWERYTRSLSKTNPTSEKP